jgi:ADP-heptose:LPS heptosyltransferase
VILILRALGIGDLATAAPALHALRATFPGRRLAPMAGVHQPADAAG